MNLLVGARRVWADRQIDKTIHWLCLVNGGCGVDRGQSVLAGHYSALYFTGYKFMNKKAVGLGLGSVPFDVPIHRTMAEGFSTFVNLYLFLAILLVMLISGPFEFSFDRLYRSVANRQSHKNQWKKDLDELVSMRGSLSERVQDLRTKAEGGHDVSSEISQLENEANEALKKAGKIDRSRWWRSFLSGLILGAKASFSVVGILVLFAMWGGGMGSLEAKRVREKVDKGCTGCSVFSDGTTSTKGVSIF